MDQYGVSSPSKLCVSFFTRKIVSLIELGGDIGVGGCVVVIVSCCVGASGSSLSPELHVTVVLTGFFLYKLV